MSVDATFQGLSRGTKWGLFAGVMMVWSGLANHSWLGGLAGVGILAAVGWVLYSANVKTKAELEPWPWPADLRAQAEAMARPIDPTPKRLLPPDEKAAMVATVATTKEALAQLIADKPHAWPWAVFTSVLVQRRNAVQTRLRAVVSGYQPRGGAVPISGKAYSAIAFDAMNAIVDLVRQLEQFMLSPAFKGAFGGGTGDEGADADAIVSVAKRLMDYHNTLLDHAETCLQTPVNSEAFVFVQDVAAFTLCPLVGYQQFITTMCARIGEAQDLLPYTSAGDVIWLDEVLLTITMPDGLMDRLLAHIKRFTE
jgi:hypothetical protein